MTEPHGPTVRRRRLGSELRRLREAGNLRLEDVAKVLDCSTSKVSRIENGQGLAKTIEINAMLDLFKVSEPEARAKVTNIHKQAGEQGWWEQAEYEQVLPSGLGVYVGLEYDARALRSWDLGWVPGLLQTEAYARAVLSDSRSVDQAVEIDRLVSVRTERQKRLTAPEPLEVWAIVDESVLRRPIGGSAVMREQAEHLLKMAALPNVTLQVYPFAKGTHPGLRGSFSILEFGASDPDTVYVESPSGNAFVERDRQVVAFNRTFNHLCASALDPEESVALVRAC
ncbi:helix-turn-helix transcriptional regulator [Embleya sp. NPDC005575]|uniref:helix-turn-helix domain-containing protein n=1 Tax=Embleya sp. NPDC005575 TaxID=3156892 RepID=UPI0033B75A0D